MASAKPRTKPDPAALLKKLSAICLELPEAEIEVVGRAKQHATFRVRKKVFCYFLNSHHGDSIISVCFKCLPGEQEGLIEMDAKRYYSPAYIGPRGWAGLRLDIGAVSWPQVEQHITQSWRLTAPKTLARQLG